MKRLLLIALCFVCASSMAFAQWPGSIGAFGDAGATDCNITDTGSLVEVHIVHVYAIDVAASEFMLDVSATNWTHMGDTWDFDVYIGTPLTGASVAYEDCLDGPIHLVTVNFWGTSAPSCTYIRIVPDPLAVTGEIEAVDCDYNRIFPTGGRAIVNVNDNCRCCVPVEETTWGGVKALYR
jgi:hypothetical protein